MPSLRPSLRALRALGHLTQHPPRRWLLAAEAVWQLAQVKRTLQRVPFSKYGDQFAPTALGQRRIERERVAEVVWAVDRVSQLLPEQLNCLPRALSVQAMLRRRGTEGVLRFGVRKTEQGALTAHAWVELDDEVIIGAVPNLDQYARLSAWPGATP